MAERFGTYDRGYRAAHRDGARSSAAAVMPVVVDAVRPESVLDVGCGCGDWLMAARALGVDDVLGIDGPWIGADELAIAPAEFCAVQLAGRFDAGRRFDLVLCLEVAEHLRAASADPLVASLVAHAPVVLFSAAIPGQGGEGHVHEAWASEWRARFAARGWACFDLVRERFWTDARVEVWYRQNARLFVDRARLAADTEMRARLGGETGRLLDDVVHPELAESWARRHRAQRLETNRRLEAARARVLELGAWGENLVRELEATRTTLARTEAELRALRTSRSWRWTQPLRMLHRATRRARREEPPRTNGREQNDPT
jgi:SAM-dependent methyltransferase